jgi:hypothetical protein
MLSVLWVPISVGITDGGLNKHEMVFGQPRIAIGVVPAVPLNSTVVRGNDTVPPAVTEGKGLMEIDVCDGDGGFGLATKLSGKSNE